MMIFVWYIGRKALKVLISFLKYFFNLSRHKTFVVVKVSISVLLTPTRVPIRKPLLESPMLMFTFHSHQDADLQHRYSLLTSTGSDQTQGKAGKPTPPIKSYCVEQSDADVFQKNVLLQLNLIVKTGFVFSFS